jgi:superfamily I DNA/RNA helicase
MTRLHRVVGPPGCGKTSWLARQAQQAAAKYGSGGVVIASLTRAAAAEVAGRETNIAASNVGTLHSHAFRALGRPNLAETPEGLKAWTESHPRWKLGGRFDPTDPYSSDPFASDDAPNAERELQDYARARTAAIPRELWPSSLLVFAEAWEDFKRQTNRLDFCDLIEHATSETESHPAKPAVVMVDEAQDISALERGLVDRWAQADGVQQVVIVGDPDQNLYQWRGSDPDVFWRGEAETERVLEQSYRVPVAPHAYAVDWIDRTPDRRPVVYLPTPEPGRVERALCTFDRPDAILERIIERSAEGRSSMLLASCSYMLATVVSTLRAEAIPFHNPYRSSHGGWNPLGGAGRVLALLRPRPDVWQEQARHWTWHDVWRWMEPMRAEHFERGAKAYVERQAGPDQYGTMEHAHSPSDAAWLVENMTEEAAGAIGAFDLAWWLDSLLVSKHGQQAYSVALALKHGGAKLREEPRVIVGTIHSVKGGEADDVYVCPDLSGAGERERVGSVAGREALRRMFYVAFTRSKDRLYLADPSGRRFAQLPRPL